MAGYAAVRRPSCLVECAESKLEIFISPSETDACFLREAKQPKSEEERGDYEKQWSAISVFEPQECGQKQDSEKNSGTKASVQTCEDAALQVMSTALQSRQIALEVGAHGVVFSDCSELVHAE